MTFKLNYFTKQRVLSYSILLFSIIPILPNRIKGLPVAILFIVSIFFYKKKKINKYLFLLNASLYLLYLISYFLSNKTGEVTKLLETSLSILLLPLIFYILLSEITFKNKIKLQFYNTFIIATLLFSFLIVFSVFADSSVIYYSNWHTNKARTIVETFPFIGQHPIYASIFFSLSILFATDIIKNFNSNGFNLKMYYLVIFLNTTLLLFFLSKGVIIALLVTFFFIFFLKSKWSKKKSITLVASIILITSLFLFNRRMNELINFDTYKKVDTNYSTGLRMGIYKCVFNLATEEWITGYGIGNTQQVLNSCYSKNSSVLLLKVYNSHNQYLDILLKTGIFGLLVFLYFLRINYINAKKNNNFIVTYIIIFFCIVFLIENLLLRQTGVILFYFLITFFSRFLNDNNIEPYKDATTKYI